VADMLSRLPELPDEALATLRGNAERLSRDGKGQQRAAAAALMPAVLAEISRRAEAKAAAKPKKGKPRKTP
jgi:hypothetical protein